MTVVAAPQVEPTSEHLTAIANERTAGAVEPAPVDRTTDSKKKSSSRPICDARDLDLVAALRQGDESAFARLVNENHRALLRVARAYVPSAAIAEEVVQETWLGVLRGVESFEGRGSLKAWIFQILINRARTRGERESRTVAFSALQDRAEHVSGSSINPSRQASCDPERQNWLSPSRTWDMTPEQLLLSQECRAYIERAIASLPPNQQEAITLRDVQGWASEEVCEVLGISEVNCRVLLHRARAKVRQALEEYLAVGIARSTYR